MAASRDSKPQNLLDLFRPFLVFTRVEVLGGTLLLVAAIVALVWANSPWAESYQWLWSRQITLALDSLSIVGSLEFWINDLLMVFFFLLVGMEIKRELAVGELNSVRRASLPVMAALGGMLVPAGIYAAINWGGDGIHGWGIPMATDIAFALGAMRLLGHRVPSGLFILLAALAIIDDLGAILVIAIFYTESLSWTALGIAGALVALLFAMNRLSVRRAGLYLIVGAPLWLAVYTSGIHATIAGVITGMMIPVRRRIDMQPVQEVAKELGTLPAAAQEEDKYAALEALQERVRRVESPLAAVEYALHPYVSYGVLPLFALANAGVVLIGTSPSLLLDPVSLGVILGLLIGKPVGIFSATMLAVKAGIAELPTGVTQRHVLGASMLAGIGFTMALFISGLAFEHGSLLHTEAKVGILAGSAVSAVLGLAFLATGKAEPSAAADAAGG